MVRIDVMIPSYLILLLKQVCESFGTEPHIIARKRRFKIKNEMNCFDTFSYYANSNGVSVERLMFLFSKKREMINKSIKRGKEYSNRLREEVAQCF